VEDTGIGIRPEERHCLFNLFEINRINKEKKNVGLGLSISYILSKQLGERLRFESAAGTGTLMSFKVLNAGDGVKNSQNTLGNGLTDSDFLKNSEIGNNNLIEKND